MNEREQQLQIRRAARRRKRILGRTLGLTLAGEAAAGGLYYWKVYLPSLHAETVIYKETTVQQGDMNLGFEESGNVSLASSYITYDLNLDTAESDSDDDEDDDDDTKYLKIEEVYAVQGQRITEGDPLFRLTDSSVRSVRRILEAAVSDAAVELAEAKSEYTLKSQTAANTAGSAKVRASVAEETYAVTVEELQNEMDSLLADIGVLTRDIEICQENLADEDYLDEYHDAQDAYEDTKELFENTDETNTVAYIANQKSYLSAKSALEAYEDQIGTWNDTITSDREQIEQDQAKYQKYQKELTYRQTAAAGEKTTAQMTGSLADETCRNTVSSLEESVTEAQSTYEEAEEALSAFNNFVGDDNIVYADGSGLVTEVQYEAGDELSSGGTMLAYTKSDGYTISVDVSEEDIPSVSVGEEVSIVFTAYPEETYTGRVSVISSTASDSHASTVSYPVTISVDGDTSKLYGGMTADVTFVTESVKDAVYVPSKAIVEQDGQNYVYVSDGGGGYTLRAVTTGISDGTSTQITDGVSAGEKVYIRSVAAEDEAGLRDTEESGGGKRQ